MATLTLNRAALHVAGSKITKLSRTESSTEQTEPNSVTQMSPLPQQSSATMGFKGQPQTAATGAWLILVIVTSGAGIFSGCHRLHCSKYLVASFQFLLLTHTCRIHLSSIFMMTSIL